MKGLLRWISIPALLAGTTIAWAQHGHGVAAAGGHGAPPQFNTTAKTPASGSAAAASSAAQTNNVSTHLANNPALAARVQPLLPSGATLSSAATGFRNQGQFIAALHVSHNLNIPFSQLKADMTGGSHDSLGQAIHDLRPNLGSATVKSNVKLAQRQARQDIHSKTAADPASIAGRISQNTGLASRVNALLPSGTTLQAATVGFKSQGQFIAALHVSRNLNIPFSQLQAEVAGGKTLGQAIADLKPALSSTTVQADVRTAERQSRRDIESTEQTGVASTR